MSTVFWHFMAGTGDTLPLFLIFLRLSGAKSGSVPLSVIFMGITCASLAHFLSPWATPIVLLLFLFSCINKLRLDHAATKEATSKAEPE